MVTFTYEAAVLLEELLDFLAIEASHKLGVTSLEVFAPVLLLHMEGWYEAGEALGWGVSPWGGTASFW